jgi:hypothetical protein
MSADFDLLTNEAGHLVLVEPDGTRHENVRPMRIFPLTQPDLWISLQDTNGVELACVENPASLPESKRAALNRALSARDFVPVIRSINRITRAADGHEWHVVTDRGPTTFRVETDESIQNLGGMRLVIIDVRNTRYLIPNIASLDRESQRKLERYY